MPPRIPYMRLRFMRREGGYQRTDQPDTEGKCPTMTNPMSIACSRHSITRNRTGCHVTSIPKLLGHRSLDSTMVYARVHDRTVAEDYYAAMFHIEKQLDLNAGADNADEPVGANERVQLRGLLNRLAEPQLGLDARLDLNEQMRRVLQ